ncbi:MAG: DUF1801 domain-containing protein [Thermoplasmata archaeon]|jgi:uncharacterized protein YdhG (YjbR/CyaY superfamily)|nr:DUF1801 domain-containing protein [Thermoplasmata archaeon]
MAARKTGAKGGKSAKGGFTEEERSAMRERARELRAPRGSGKSDGEGDVKAKIAQMSPSDRAIALRVHAIIRANAPTLSPRTWYGMPAYSKGDQVLCFFRNAGKFKTRYSTLGFSDEANLDDGPMWPTDFAITNLTGAEETRIIALLKKALG